MSKVKSNIPPTSNNPTTTSTDFFANGNVKTIPNIVSGSYGDLHTNIDLSKYRYGPYTASPEDDISALQTVNRDREPLSNIFFNTSIQGGANFISGLGQSLANMFDLHATAKTVRGELTGSKDNFESSFLGISTSDMQRWQEKIAKNAPIDDDPDSLDYTDIHKWATQIAQLGTSVGMATGAIVSTAAIEYATGGLGTGAVLARLGTLGKKLFTGAKAAETLGEAYSIAKGMRSAATVFGILNRYSESRMEASQTYKELYDQLSSEKNPDETPKYSKEEVQLLASKGARRTFNLNELLTPLDIMSYRMMVFNPITGSAEGGLIEGGLEKIATSFGKSKIGKGLGYITSKALGAIPEGIEEQSQHLFQDEGKHYAKVVAGEDDGQSFLDRFSDSFFSNSSINEGIGGYLGGLVLGPLMSGGQRIINKGKIAKQQQIYKTFLEEVPKVNDVLSNRIREAESQGNTELASNLRRQFNNQVFLANLHMDALNNKTTSFDNRMTFLEGILDEVNNNKFTGLNDLGFTSVGENTINQVKTEFGKLIEDGKKLKQIYNQVADKYNRNFVPQITWDNYRLSHLLEQKVELETKAQAAKANLFQYDGLSSVGKEQLDAEYQLTSINYEIERLNNKYKNTEDEQEKQNINTVIENSKAKAAKIAARLEEIGKDENYSKEDREKDKDIIDTSILNQDYLQNTYDNIAIDNDIAVARKDLALWNNKEYVNKKIKESISKAKTKEQVNNIRETADKSLVSSLDNKEKQIAATETKQNKKLEDNKKMLSADSYGNADLFEEGIDEDDSSIGNNKFPENTIDGESEAIFSPATFNSEERSETSKNKIVAGVRGMLEELGDNRNFEGLLNLIIQRKGKEFADESFNALVYGAKENGIVDNFEVIYNKVFSSPIDEFEQGFRENTEVINPVERVLDKTLDLEDTEKEFNDGGIAVNTVEKRINYTSEFGVTHEEKPKLAYSILGDKQILIENEDGTLTSKYISNDNNTIPNYINPLPLLNPDEYKEGTELEAIIPDNYLDIYIPIYNQNGYVESMPFGQWLANNSSATPDTQEYRDKVPIIVYDKGKVGISENARAFIHDIGWYNNAKFDQDKPEEREKAIANTRAERDIILDNHSNNKSTILKITGIRQTTFNGLKQKNSDGSYKNISIRESNPQAMFATGIDSNSIRVNGTNLIYPNNSVHIVRDKPYSDGTSYVVMRYGNQGDKPAYQVFPVTNPKISLDVKKSIQNALMIYANQFNPDSNIREIHDRLHEKLLSETNINVKSKEGIIEYLSKFITIFNTSNANNEEDVEKQVAAKYGNNFGKPYIAIDKYGKIVFGVYGEGIKINQTKRNNLIKSGMPEDEATAKATIYSYYVQPNTKEFFQKNEWIAKNIRDSIKALGSDRILGKYEQRIHNKSLAANKPVALIVDGDVKRVANNHRDYLLDTMQINIKAINVGTEKEPLYVVSNNAIITYQSKESLSKEETNKDNTANEIKAILPEPNVLEITDDKEKEINEAINRAKQFGIKLYDEEEENFSPEIIEDSIRDKVRENLNTISNLTAEQLEHVVNMMYNHIITSINFEVKNINKNFISSEIDSIFNSVINPQLELLNTEIENNNKLLEKYPDEVQINSLILSYQQKINKIISIRDNIGVLKDIAFERVQKRTGITENTILTEITLDSLENEDEIDFSTDILAENPKSKITYNLRRFLSGVKQYDNKGNEIRGFLNLPLYTNESSIIAKLMTLLSDTNSDFNTMLSKLKTYNRAIPWMNAVAEKLEKAPLQTKEQFVTVMTKSSLRMKFAMIEYNNFTKSYTAKVWDAALTGTASTIKTRWKNNFKLSNLITTDENNEYILEKERAKYLINQFESWTGVSLKEIKLDKDEVKILNRVKKDNGHVFMPTGNLLQQLKTNLPNKTSRVLVKNSGTDYQITYLGDGKYKIEYLNKKGFNVEPKDIKTWLANFGIELTDLGLKDILNNGMFHNYKKVLPNQLFETENGLFKILYNELKYLVQLDEPFIFNESGRNPLNNTVVSSLAENESKFSKEDTPFGFWVAGKRYFALTSPKFITDKVLALKQDDKVAIQELQNSKFNNSSLILKLLNESDKFRSLFNVSHISPEAIKEKGKDVIDSNSVTGISDVDYELMNLTFLQDTKQGEIEYGEQLSNKYPGTNISMRMGTMLNPTMSDKDVAMLYTTAILKFRNQELSNGDKVSDEVIKVLYEQLIKPELKRIIDFHRRGSKTNISGYDKGARLFMFLPQMNYVKYNNELTIIEAIENLGSSLRIEDIENNQDISKEINNLLHKYIESELNTKINNWVNAGIIEYKDNEISSLNFIDKSYEKEFSGTIPQKARMMALDMILNNQIALANSFMIMGIDPAMLYKKNKDTNNNDYIKVIEDSFTNIGKRLALMIAPGTIIANSENDQYIQIFLKDRVSLTDIDTLKYLTKIKDGNEINNEELSIIKEYLKFKNESSQIPENIDKEYKAIKKKYPKTAGFFEIDASDAQEYTTWKEHLDILSRMGKTPDSTIDISIEEIEEARKLFSSSKSKKDLSQRDLDIISKILNPMKPVYTGSYYDDNNKLMRLIYIKSSSFPLIPQLTEGSEIDGLRLSMEELQANSKKNVRASYQTANKVGSVINPLKVWDEDGRFIKENFTINKLTPKGEDQYLETSSLILPRKNFRIQQEVPFKSDKKSDDLISLGTQPMKLLFGDEVLSFDGFNYNNEILTGKELQKKYINLFGDLVKLKKDELYYELGLDENGNAIDIIKTSNKIQSLLYKEATQRDYPIQSIEGLKMNDKGEFIIPLWASVNSNRYESLLNSIVSNRLLKVKMPGFSGVLGSEEGFKTKISENIKDVENPSNIIYTSAWNGVELQSVKDENGNLKKAQIFVPSKFKDKKGNLIDLLTKQDDNYVYVNENNGIFSIKQDMFDDDLFSLTTFRIPASGHVSTTVVEIAGFLPAINGDLVIAPKGFTKQMGSDFDVDKLNIYQLFHYQSSDNSKIEVLSESHRKNILADSDKTINIQSKLVKLYKEYKEAVGERAKNKLYKEIESEIAQFNLAKTLFDEADYTSKDIEDSGLYKINSKITEKLIKNNIIRIHNSVLSSSNPNIQSKINDVLNTDFADQQAEYIDSLRNLSKDNKYWTPLSDQYQKQKLAIGASGKKGTGAFSLDVTFHSLLQQLNTLDKPITLRELVSDNEQVFWKQKTWRFGNYESNSVLGGNKTIDGSRTISDLLKEMQQVAVDNEKLQIMGRVGLNDDTLDIFKVFALTGLDKNESGNSIAMLFLSQPIIQEFTKKLKNSKSIIAEFKKDREQAIIDELLTKYENNPTLEENDTYWDRMSSQMNNKNLTSAISSENPIATHGELQGAVLRRFLDMRKYGIALRQKQTAINIESSGLGKSFFDVIESKKEIEELQNDNIINGSSNLIGIYSSTEDLEEKLRQGYVLVNDKLMILPNTVSGMFNVHGIMTAYNIWNKYFPYDAKYISNTFDKLISIYRPNTPYSTTELRQKILRDIKRYMNTRNDLGITEENIEEKRKELFIDTDENISLARYIKELLAKNDIPVIDTFIKTNKLLNSLEYSIEKNGEPSLIKFNNAAEEEFDEKNLYDSLAILISARGKNGRIQLPQIGNKQYTLDSLAKALIQYSLLGNSIQEAVQFTKFVPVNYLSSINYAKTMRAANNLFSYDASIFGANMGYTNTSEEKKGHMVSEFIMQNVQHNPDLVYEKLDSKQWNKQIAQAKSVDGKENPSLNDLYEFKLLNITEYPTFLTIYNKNIKIKRKQQLYWFNGTKYIRLPILGSFGMDEYHYGAGIGNTIVNNRFTIRRDVQGQISDNTTLTKDNTTSNIPFNIQSNNLKTIIGEISKESDYLGVLAKELLPYISDNTKIEFVDSILDKQNNVRTNFMGHYDRDNRVISINNRILNNVDSLKTTILHELVHDLTIHAIRPHITINKDKSVSVNDNAPNYILELVRLFNFLKANVSQEQIDEVLSKIRNNQAIGTDAKSNIYGYTNIYEFITMALTDKGFQQALSSIEYKQTGKSLLDKFKEILNQIFKSLGINFEENKAISQAISSIFDLIQNENKSNNPYQDKKDIADNISEDTPPDIDLLPFPTDNLIIKNEKC